MFGTIKPKLIAPKPLLLVDQLGGNEAMRDLITQLDDPTFKITYELTGDRKGYWFKFPESRYNKMTLATAFLTSNIHKTSSHHDCSSNSWDKEFYLWITVIQERRFDVRNGLNYELAYQLTKKCCEKFNITLDELLDKDLPRSGFLPVRVKEVIIQETEEDEAWEEEEEIEEMPADEINTEALSFIENKIKRDFNFLKAFEAEFKETSFLVIETFDHFLNFHTPDELIVVIKDVWVLVRQKEDDNILFYLTLIQKYVGQLLQRKDDLEYRFHRHSRRKSYS